MNRKRFKNTPDLHLEKMFETRSEAWEAVGLAMNISQRAVRRARREMIVVVPLLIGVLVVYFDRQKIFGLGPHEHTAAETWLQWGTVIALLALGWTVARDIGRAAGPTFFRRMDPATAGTVGASRKAWVWPLTVPDPTTYPLSLIARASFSTHPVPDGISPFR